MDYSTCQPVQQFMSKYPEINIVDIVTLCKEIVSIKNEPKTVNMDNQKDISTMTVKELRALGKQFKVKKYYNMSKEQLIAELVDKQPEPQSDGKTSFFKKQKTTKTTIIQKEETTCVETTTEIPQEQPTEGQEEKKEEEIIPPPPPPPCTGKEFDKYINTYTEGLSEEILEYMILDGTTYIGGNINNKKSGVIGIMTKVVRMYVREMKAKYNKEYEQLNFDETLEEQQIQIEKEKRRQKEEEEEIQAKNNELNSIIIQNLIYQEDNLTKKDLEYIIQDLLRNTNRFEIL